MLVQLFLERVIFNNNLLLFNRDIIIIYTWPIVVVQFDHRGLGTGY